MEINFWEIFKNALLSVSVFWPILLFAIAIIAIRIMIEFILPNQFKKIITALRFNKGEKWRNDREYLNWLRSMKPKEFEEYIAELFSRLGYKTRTTGGPHDGGIDVVAKKDKIKHYIQCKKYFARHEVGVGEVRDFYGSIADHLTNGKGYFITTNKFTLAAEKFVEDKPIELIDSFKLLEYIQLANKNFKKNNEKICPSCGGKLKERTGKYGKFLGCSNYPGCKYVESIKKS
jgi:HJR/Mrr/RecB family endonuclease